MFLSPLPHPYPEDSYQPPYFFEQLQLGCKLKVKEFSVCTLSVMFLVDMFHLTEEVSFYS